MLPLTRTSQTTIWSGSARALAADGFFWPHCVWGCALGNPRQIAESAKMFAAAEEDCVSVYERSGLSEPEIRKLMESDRALDAETAVRLGFAHEVAAATGNVPAIPKIKTPHLGRLVQTVDHNHAKAQTQSEPAERRRLMREVSVLGTFWANLKRIVEGREARGLSGEERALPGGLWKCPDCGKINSGNPRAEGQEPCAWCRGESNL